MHSVISSLPGAAFAGCPGEIFNLQTVPMAASSPPDEALVEDCLAGDDGAFEELVSRHKRKVLGIVSNFARNAHELDDVAQEAFLAAYRRLHKFRADAPFENWLCRIVTRKCYDLLRGRQRRREQETVDFESLDFRLEDEGAASECSAREARELIHFGLAKMKPDEQLVITLLELEQQSIKEIAGHTGWSESNVKVRAHRARQKLKEILTAHVS